MFSHDQSHVQGDFEVEDQGQVPCGSNWFGDQSETTAQPGSDIDFSGYLCLETGGYSLPQNGL